jgi:Uma2 family endonuclease
VGSFYKKLDRFVAGRGLGEVFLSPLDVILTQRRVVQPDVFFISKARLGMVKDYIDGVPDLAMEVISEQSWKRDRIEKKALYEQFGLPEYWIVDPDSETIEVFALAKGVYQVHSRAVGAQMARSKLLPGFGITSKELLR